MVKISQADFNGKAILPEDTEYEKARGIFYGGFDKKPAVIIRVADAGDVVKAINSAKSNGVELAVRGGGHSIAGHSTTDGGIVIDLRDMRRIEIDATSKTAWAETGLTARDVTNEADKHNLVLGFGDTGSVGIGGITLGGGIGFLVRKYGMAIDNLLAAEIVTADGQVLQVDDKNHSDIFWAIRGGGGNFGVVTKFKYKLHTLQNVIGGMLFLPATPEVISGFIDKASKAPDELSTIINIMPAMPMPFVPAEYHGKICVMALMMYAGDPVQGEKVIAQFKELAKPIADMIKPMRYKDIFFPDNDSYHPTAVAKNMFMKTVDNSLAERIIYNLTQPDASMRVVQLRVLGGAIGSVPEDATAFAHRKSPIMCNVAAFYKSEEERKKRLEWVNALSQELYQGDDGVYVGFMGMDDGNRINNAYPEATRNRLMEIKKRYYPDNLFRLNFNILPPV